MYKHISAPKHHQTTIVARFYSISDTISNESFHPVVLYDNDLICIFMNINENLELRKKTLGTLVKVCVCVFFLCFFLGWGGGGQSDLHRTHRIFYNWCKCKNVLKSKCALVK